ncbi:MoaD/ThiS family protein [uncultured Limosilactobacillus sp.]|uniref:MoaD/ThiS family protein n=1 Tax=uncultured Limosilactobacillus sp. TaxID=2837629 RepID=UPI0026604CE7|nr:MoaD/ThiS family protein [uncultured Limosilactobacillus sp.]
MEVKIRLFAFLQDQLGPSITVEVTNPVRIKSLLNQISQKAPQLSSTLANSRLAVNQEFINDEEVILKVNDEIAIIPPVSGG